MANWERNLNALLIIILGGVLLSAYGVQFLYHEEPCPLCMLQRLGMIAVASGAALNLWFGVRMQHYALSLIGAVAGGSVALRQISLHVCPGSTQFGFPVIGLSLYTWSFVVFVCSVLAIALLLLFYRPGQSETPPERFNGWCKFALGVIFAIALANVVTTFMQCGLSVCHD